MVKLSFFHLIPSILTLMDGWSNRCLLFIVTSAVADTLCIMIK